jgi:hypothetical protein
MRFSIIPGLVMGCCITVLIVGISAAWCTDYVLKRFHLWENIVGGTLSAIIGTVSLETPRVVNDNTAIKRWRLGMDKTEKVPMTAAETAWQRFETYIAKKLRNEDDLTAWEFYTWLLEKAERRDVDSSGYAPLEYQEDRRTDRTACLVAHAKQRDVANEAKEE